MAWSRPSGGWKALLVATALLAGLFAVLEGTFRLAGPSLGVERARLADYRRFLLDGKVLNYEPRAHTVFQRRARARGCNSWGFSDVEWRLPRTPGVPRILCLGASTTEGGNPSGPSGSYPFQLEQMLEERAGRDCEVLNAGISGWTTAEMLVSWFLCLQDFAPDVLVIHEGVSDMHARFRTNFRADYSHWRVPWPDVRVRGLERLAARSDLYLFMRLQRSGVPDVGTLTSTPRGPQEPAMREGRLTAETARPFRRNVESIAESARSLGARVVLMTMPMQPGFDGPSAAVWRYGIDEYNRILHELAAGERAMLVDAARVFAERPELGQEFRDIVHLDPAGNRVKAELVADALLASGALPAGPAAERATPPPAGTGGHDSPR